MSPSPSSSDPPAGAAALPPESVQAHAGEAARLLKALGNEQRLLVLCHLLDGPLTVSELNRRVSLSQSALSQHLALLREMGLVETRREAQSIHYSLPDGPVVRVMALLQELYCPAPPAAAADAAESGARALCDG